MHKHQKMVICKHVCVYFNKGLQQSKNLKKRKLFEQSQFNNVSRKAPKKKKLPLLQMMILYFDKGLEQFKGFKKENQKIEA